MGKWITENIPDLSGKTMLVTGANSGIGFETSLALAKKGTKQSGPILLVPGKGHQNDCRNKPYGCCIGGMVAVSTKKRF